MVHVRMQKESHTSDVLDGPQSNPRVHVYLAGSIIAEHTELHRNISVRDERAIFGLKRQAHRGYHPYITHQFQG